MSVKTVEIQWVPFSSEVVNEASASPHFSAEQNIHESSKKTSKVSFSQLVDFVRFKRGSPPNEPTEEYFPVPLSKKSCSLKAKISRQEREKRCPTIQKKLDVICTACGIQDLAKASYILGLCQRSDIANEGSNLRELAKAAPIFLESIDTLGKEEGQGVS